MKAIHLQVNHMTEPVGIDREPQFFWQCEGGKTQSAYQITVRRNGGIIWDSGKVSSNKMNNIPYAGPSLNSRDVLEWSVTLWDENDEKGEPSSSCLEMGLLKNPITIEKVTVDTKGYDYNVKKIELVIV